LCDPTLHLGEAVVEVGRLAEASPPVYHVVRLRLVKEGTIVQLVVIDLLHLVLDKPFYSFAVLPEPILHLLVLRYYVLAESVLFSLVPVSFVASLIGPGVDAEAVLLVILILSLVLAPVVPDIDTHPLHIVV